MSTSELKATLNSIINKTDDKTVLNDIYESVAKVLSSKKSPFIKLTAAEKKTAAQALDAVKNGEVFSHEKAMGEMKKKYASLHK